MLSVYLAHTNLITLFNIVGFKGWELKCISSRLSEIKYSHKEKTEH